jgi:hypothetical protein
MVRVTGLGGVFFKSEDPERLFARYEKHLGLKSYGRFAWIMDPDGNRI